MNAPPEKPLRVIVLARDQKALVQKTWSELSVVLQQQPGVELVAAEVTEDLHLEGIDADLVLVLGGDGAILRACRKMGWQQLPILGVNLGRLGFLADLSPEEFLSHLSTIVERRYTIVDHLMFECVLKREGHSDPERWLGLNEVVISSSELKMLDIPLEIDGQIVTTYSGDGLIISTPVGSTAHSLSAGGPILRQDLQAFVVTPICPHTLTVRPLVDRADCVYSFRLSDPPKGTMLVIDGQIRRELQAGDLLEVRKASVGFQLVKLPGSNYYATLHRKLGWGGQPRYRDLNPPPYQP